MTRRHLVGLVGLLAVVGFLGIELAAAQQILRNGFETQKMGWLKAGFDVPYEEKIHAISNQVAHEGRHSEYIQLNVKPRPNEASTLPYIHYAYPIGKAIIGEELAASIWIKSNRPDMQLMARVVLPRERDPSNLDHLLTTYIRGDVYKQVGQWQQLQLPRPVALAKKQQQLMQQASGRPIDFTDAYIDGLVLNVYGGPGLTDIWIDDVEVGPVMAATPITPAIRPAGPVDAQPTKTIVPRPDRKGLPVEFNGGRLKVANRPFFFTGIVVTDTPLDKLREARFNTVFLDSSANSGRIHEAADRGFWVVPMLRVFGDDAKPISPDDLGRALSRFSDAEVLFANLGQTLPFEYAAQVERAAQAIRTFEPGRVIGGDVWDGLKPYSRPNILQLVGGHRWPLMTTMELTRYRDWLRLRRDLANPSMFLWTTVQTHLPEALTQLLHERSADASFDEPVGPQAEQVQLLTWAALSAGCKGLVFSSDRFLADSHQGRDRLLACALMNLQLEMLEPFIATADDSPETAYCWQMDVKAAVLRSPLGMLLLPVWQGPFGQFVPGQAAVHDLTIVAPPMQPSMQAWEITPAEVRRVKTERVAGATRIKLKDFGLTSAILLTSDNDLIGRLQEQAKARRHLAAEWSRAMAAYEFAKVVKIQEQLERQGHTFAEARKLIADSQQRLADAEKSWDNHAFADAYRQAQAALRPLRILMRRQWESAVRGTDSPAVTPYSVSFFTLPKHWQFMDEVKSATAGPNVLPGGDFEGFTSRPEDTWRPEERPSLDGLEVFVQRVGQVDEPELKKDSSDAQKDKGADSKSPADSKELPAEPKTQEPKLGDDGKPMAAELKVVAIHKQAPHEGKQCAMLKVEVKPNRMAPPALERTIAALNSPIIRMPPGAIVRISGWVCVPQAITASPDGAVFYDSVGGDALGLRLFDPTPWKKLTYYRRVPPSGTIQVTLALSGIGTVYFDDIRIEEMR